VRGNHASRRARPRHAGAAQEIPQLHYCEVADLSHSILRFTETRFDPALSARDANADPMLDLFDFANPPFVKPPHLPAAPVGPHRAEQCLAIGAEEVES
jgi:hypothetical protein